MVFVWGLLHPPVRDKWKFSDFTSECGRTACGNASVDEDFNLASPVVQEWIVYVCERGREFELVKLKRTVHCALEDFRDWLEQMNEQINRMSLLDDVMFGMSDESTPTYPKFPVPESEFYDLFEEFLSNPMMEAKYLNENHIILDKKGKRVEVLTVAWQSEFVELTFTASESLHDKFEAWKKFEAKCLFTTH